MHIDREHFWTDSQIVLEYTVNDAKRFGMYVANRVRKIREQWQHVPGLTNNLNHGFHLHKKRSVECYFVYTGSFLLDTISVFPLLKAIVYYISSPQMLCSHYSPLGCDLTLST